MNTAALETRGLHKSFGSLVVARDVSIALPHGARHAMIGPNGAGKTTLINLITGALQPDSGRIMLGERDITALAPERRAGDAGEFTPRCARQRPRGATGHQAFSAGPTMRMIF